MKQRSTFLITSPTHTEDSNFAISPNSLRILSLSNASREDRITLSPEELPSELLPILQECSELQIHWASGRPYEARDPYSSRVPAGLHVVVGGVREETPAVCELINPIFEITTCHGLRESFIDLPNTGGMKLFYHPLKSIHHFSQYLSDKTCGTHEDACKSRFAELEKADYIDLKWDVVSQTLVGSAFYGDVEAGEEGLVVGRRGQGERVEVGVLGVNEAMEEEGVTLGGVLQVVGEEKMSPALFTVPSRHHTHPAAFNLTLIQPTGLHPKLALSISGENKAPNEECTLNAKNFLESLNLTRIRSLTGETDLEAPNWSSKLWGSSLLLELSPHAQSFEIPTHLRYLPPKEGGKGGLGAMEKVEFPEPAVFWACRSENWGKVGKNPFDRTRLGWEGSFSEQTGYWHLSPNGEMWKSVEVPVLGLESKEWVKWGTVAAVGAGLGWVVWKVVKSVMAGGRVEGEKKRQ